MGEAGGDLAHTQLLAVLGIPDGLPMVVAEERGGSELTIVLHIRGIQGVGDFMIPAEVFLLAPVVPDAPLLCRAGRVCAERAGRRLGH